jgi:hypothetical protein
MSAVVTAWRLSHRDCQLETDDFAATIALDAKRIITALPKQPIYRPPIAKWASVPHTAAVRAPILDISASFNASVTESNAIIEAVEQRAMERGQARDAAIKAIYSVYVEIGAAGWHWDNVQVGLEDERFRAITRPLHDFDPASLRGKIVLARNLADWLATNPEPASEEEHWWNLSATRLASYLRARSVGGPTVAGAVYQGLAWWWRYIGTPLPISHRAVINYNTVEAGHVTRQAIVLQPADWANLSLLAAKNEGTLGLVYRLVLFCMMACIRYEHLKRSELVKANSRFVEFFCSRGKCRVKGQRHGFVFAVPRVWTPKKDLFGPLLNLWEKLEGNRFGLIPDLTYDRGVVDGNSKWCPRPMSYKKLTALMQGALIESGTSPDQTGQYTYNSMRRFLPTAGDIYEFDDVDAQALSNWQDVVHNSSGAKRERASRPMSRHYADNTTGSSAEVKVRALAATTEAIERALRGKVCCRDSGFADPHSMSWERIRLESIGQDSPTTLANMPKWFHNDTAREDESITKSAEKTRLQGDPPVDEQATENSSISSSSCSDSSDVDDKEISTAEGLADAATDARVAKTCEWFKQDSKIHLTAERSMDGRCIPFCRIESGKPFRCDARVSGTGADDAMEAGDICTRCMSRGPRAVKDYISHASI